MPRSRLLPRAAAALLGVLALLVAAACLAYPPEYVWRVLVWRDADADDYLRFPMRRIAPAHDAVPLPRKDQAGAVRAAWQAAGGGADMEAELAAHGTQAFLVLRGGEVVYEGYFQGTARESWVTSFSVAKSVTSVLVGIAIGERAIASIDDPVTRYLPELARRDPRFTRITLRHLLDMSSGLAYAEFPFLHGDDAKTYYDPGLRQLALLHTRIEREPGRDFHYNNYNPLLLGMVLERATGMPVAKYLEHKLWQPGGMVGAASWSLDSEEDGFEKMESGLNARAEDFARFGLLMLRQGRAGARQVVPAAWAAWSTSPPAGAPPAGYYAASPLGTQPGAWYHAAWWGLRRGDGGGDFAARGNHGQYVFVSPAHDLVIVRHGWRYGLAPAEWIRRMRAMAAELARPRGPAN